jgi:basic membrane protein A
MKKFYLAMVALIIASMVLAACGAPTTATQAPATEAPTEVVVTEAPTEAPTEAATTAPTEAPTEAAAAIKVGQVTDLGGIDDKSFNATAYAGVEQAVEELGAEGKYLESQQQSDYAKNIQQFIDEGTDLIVTVGFLLGVDTATAAKANPEQNFAIVDYAYPDCFEGAVEGETCGSSTELPNVLGLTFDTDEAAFLAGYAAAANTQTGKVGTFGGINIPTVSIFMKGFEAGVNYHNEQKGTKVEVLGWSTADNDGLFTGNFESTDDGRSFAESLVQAPTSSCLWLDPWDLVLRRTAKKPAPARSLVWIRTGLSRQANTAMWFSPAC